MTSLTRGPLPAGVYWRRRVAVLLTLVVLVGTLLSSLLGRGDQEPDLAASPAAGTSTPSAGTDPSDPSEPSEPAEAADTSDTAGPTDPATPAPTTPAPTTPTETVPTPAPLAAPVGRCDNTDVLVTPQVVDAVAGRAVTLAMTVRTVSSPACTWRMSAQHLAVTLTRDVGGATPREVWSTRQCPGLVPAQDVVVRRDVDSTVTLDWDARYSERGCPARSGWVEPGELQVAAAAYGGQPATVDLELRAPGAAAPTDAEVPTVPTDPAVPADPAVPQT